MCVLHAGTASSSRMGDELCAQLRERKCEICSFATGQGFCSRAFLYASMSVAMAICSVSVRSDAPSTIRL